jgi:nucleotide-binding universal stress UspA family protein
MSFTWFALVVVIAWFAIGLGTSYLMARRGHDAFSWWLVGTAFGPLAVGYVLNRILRERDRTDRSHGTARASSDRKVDVLVGIDGSSESEAAAAGACALLGPRLGRVVLARVLPFDTPVWSETRRDANMALELAALRVPHVEVERVLLQGRPVEELAGYAAVNGFGLLAVGSRGKGLSTALLGSVASRLARADGVPVLIVSAERAAGTSRLAHERRENRRMVPIGSAPQGSNPVDRGGEIDDA